MKPSLSWRGSVGESHPAPRLPVSFGGAGRGARVQVSPPWASTRMGSAVFAGFPPTHAWHACHSSYQRTVCWVPALAPVGLRLPAPSLSALPAAQPVARDLHWTRAQHPHLSGALVPCVSRTTALRSIFGKYWDSCSVPCVGGEPGRGPRSTGISPGYGSTSPEELLQAPGGPPCSSLGSLQRHTLFFNYYY